MRRILFSETDFSALPNPPAGFKYIGFDGPNFTSKDETGTSVPTGSGGAGLLDVSYNELTLLIGSQSLTPGTYYRITDFRTCYDQPNYDENGEAITVGNYKVGSTHSIIVFATSENVLSADAYQADYPNDEIKYDISFNTTEVTGGTAYGRITYRKDENGNAFDYDFREVLFKRYDAYFSEEVYNGLISIDFSISGVNIADITGVGTNFNIFATGSVIGVLNTNNNPIINYYEILEVLDDNNMVVTGNTIITGEEVRLVDSNLLEGRSWKQNNIISSTASYEYPTFGNINQCFSNTTTTTTTYTVWDENTFLLPNNVFKGNNTYKDNSFGHDFRNNTFNTSCDSNRIGGSFYNNIIDNDFDNNIINDNFHDNIIDCDFRRNIINGPFYNNHFGDADGDDFDYNIIHADFYGNFYTGDGDFVYNTIKGDFYENITIYGLSKNTFNGVFRNNVLEGQFEDNQIGDDFYDNEIFGTFLGNVIGNNFYNNNFYADVVEDNQIGSYFSENNIGDSGNGTGNYYRFSGNTIGKNFASNTTLGGDDEYFRDNQIGDNFTNNNIYGEFERNVIGNDFNSNQSIGTRFNDNKIGNYFNYNYRIGVNFYSNVIGNYFESNRVGNNFERNRIGDAFASNQIDNGLFDWGELNNLVDRQYDTFYYALDADDENLGEYIVGENLILKDTVNDEYYKVKFTQWTQNNNGGGFSYERTKVNPTTGDNIGDTVYFTKINGATASVDVIVPGVLEITRGNNRYIYNSATESNADSSSAPTGTQWNSRFLASNNGALFQDNNIKNDFQNNRIYKNFEKNNIENSFTTNFIYNPFFENTEVGNYFFENTIGIGLTASSSDFSKNKIGNGFGKNFLPGYFESNVIGNGFYSNDFIGGVALNNIKNYFQNNDIDDSFEANEIGNYFEENTIGQNFQNNNIKENFYSNLIAQNFAQNTIGNNFVLNNIESYFGYGSDESKGNKIANNFQNNHVGEYFYDNNISDNFIGNTMSLNFQYNDVKTKLTYTDFTTYNGNIVDFTTNFTGELPDEVVGTTYSNVSGTYSYGGSTASIVVDAVFDIFVLTQGTVIATLVSPGKYYLPYVGSTASIITISGTKIGGLDVTDDVEIQIDGVSDLPSVYAEYNTEIFKRAGGVNRLSYYDASDVLTITDIDK